MLYYISKHELKDVYYCTCISVCIWIYKCLLGWSPRRTRHYGGLWFVWGWVPPPGCLSGWESLSNQEVSGIVVSSIQQSSFGFFSLGGTRLPREDLISTPNPLESDESEKTSWLAAQMTPWNVSLWRYLAFCFRHNATFFSDFISTVYMVFS